MSSHLIKYHPYDFMLYIMISYQGNNNDTNEIHENVIDANERGSYYEVTTLL